MSIEDQRDQFELIYTAAARGEQDVPWERGGPHPVLVEWVTRRRALVVGCGLGPDAEYVAGLGFDTTAFDFSPTAIRLALGNQPDVVRWRAELRRAADPGAVNDTRPRVGRPPDDGGDGEEPAVGRRSPPPPQALRRSSVMLRCSVRPHDDASTSPRSGHWRNGQLSVP